MINKVLITGGAGFIGSHIADLALQKGMEVIIFDNISSGNTGNIPKGSEFIKGDICNYNWEKLLRRVDVVIHCAAFVSAPESFSKFKDCYDTNVKATWDLINASNDARIKKFIFCSSSAVYPESEVPNYENELPKPANPYGLTKLDIEHILAMFNQEYDFSYTALRYFNVFGPRQDVNSEYSAVIPIFITRALDNKDLIIYGSGKQRRDFIYVSDVANAVLTFAKNNINGVFNIGTNQDYSLIELANIILKNTKSNSKIVFADERLGDVMFSTADLKKQKDTGVWTPRITFDDGLQKTINYYTDNS